MEKPSSSLQRPPGCKKTASASLHTKLLLLLTFLTPASFAGVIHEAARSGDLEQIQHLVVKGTSVNEKNSQDETPLIIAALAGQGEIASYLLQRGADINARNLGGLTALHAAAYVGDADIVALLIARGAAVNGADNAYRVTPLHLASEENQLEATRVLLAHGADITLLEANGYNALSRAGWRGHWDIVNALLAKGASCQPAEKVGDWLYDECTKRASAN